MLVFEHIFGDEYSECLQEYIFYEKYFVDKNVASEVILDVWKNAVTEAGMSKTPKEIQFCKLSAVSGQRNTVLVLILGTYTVRFLRKVCYYNTSKLFSQRQKHGFKHTELWLIQCDITCQISWYMER
uniref:Uncharacterized protein n=1 Tax=Molossus molossus TaxID=27622 RepID=A0A7J8DTM4_MOLMO|nr:hypothetical protein HJG59_009144 [Molossus molossus]